MCLCTCVYVTYVPWCKCRGQSSILDAGAHTSLCLKQGLLLASVCQVSWPIASRESPVSTSHLTMGALEL